jgi:TetR/AcrR family transcriptional repressor of mexJK operon
MPLSPQLTAAPTPTPATAPLPRGRGRPPVDSRENRLAMLFDGAYALLQAGEYGNFTIEAVARSAGMSRKTVYTLVASKEELIHGLILREGAKLSGLLVGDAGTEQKALDQLRGYLAVWARLALGPVGLGIYLIAVAQRDSSPAIARSYAGQGMAYAVDVLRHWLEQPAVRARFAIDDTLQAIDLVNAILIDQPLRRAALGLVRPINDADIDALVATALDTFVRCYGRTRRSIR